MRTKGEILLKSLGYMTSSTLRFIVTEHKAVIWSCTALVECILYMVGSFVASTSCWPVRPFLPVLHGPNLNTRMAPSSLYPTPTPPYKTSSHSHLRLKTLLVQLEKPQIIRTLCNSIWQSSLLPPVSCSSSPQRHSFFVNLHQNYHPIHNPLDCPRL